MRKLPLIFTGLFFALPAAAQEPTTPPDDKVEIKEATPAAKPEGPKPESEPTTTPQQMPPKPAAPKPTTPPPTNVSGPAVVANDESWKFEYHGYIRAPMRVGMGKRDKPLPGQSSTTLHSPVTPDDQFLSWQSTPHNKTDWAELFFSLGNSWAKGTVSVQGYSFAESAFSNPISQLGISDGYVDLTPDLGYENVRLAWRVGAFSNKYGGAGKYDAGEYDTYMFGRTHSAGEALHLDYDIDESNSLYIEHGIGAKKPDPSQYSDSRFTMLNHLHVGFNHTQAMQFSAHYLNSWTQEEDRNIDPAITTGSIANIPDGKMWVAGLDARFDLSAFGYLYAAYSHVGLKDAVTVGRAIDVIHASGGGEYGLGVVENYLGPACFNGGMHQYYPVGNNGLCSMGTGGVDTLLAQYEFSFTNFTQQSSGGQKFWGDGQDVKLVLYGMYNKVKSDYAVNDGIHKLKFGADVSAQLLPWLTAGLRFDRLQPNSRVPEQSFAILSPRLVFKSKWNTHEAITIQYSRYMYNQRTCANSPLDATGTPTASPGDDKCVQPPSSPVPPEGFGSAYTSLTNQRGAPTTRPDVNVFKVEATMWW